MNTKPSSSPLSHLSLWMSPIPHQGLALTSYGGDAHDVHVLHGFSSFVRLPHPCFACDVRGSLFYGGFLHHWSHLRRTSFHGPVYSFVLLLRGFYLTWKSRWIPEHFWRPNKASPLVTQPNRPTGSTRVPGANLQHRLTELDFSPRFLANLVGGYTSSSLSLFLPFFYQRIRVIGALIMEALISGNRFLRWQREWEQEEWEWQLHLLSIENEKKNENENSTFSVSSTSIPSSAVSSLSTGSPLFSPPSQIRRVKSRRKGKVS